RTLRSKAESRTRFSLVRYCTLTNSIADESLIAGARAMGPWSMESRSFLLQPSRQRPDWRLRAGLRNAPAPDVIEVNRHAEEVCGNKPPLRRTHADHDDNHAARQRDRTPMTQAASNQQRGNDDQKARNIRDKQHEIKTALRCGLNYPYILHSPRDVNRMKRLVR